MSGGASRPVDDERVRALRARAKQIRRKVVRMAAGKGEGYVGQGLDVADILAVLFLDEMHYDPVERGPEIDRLIFSAGHYSIGLWAALAEAGHLDGFDLDTYGADGTTLIMSTHEGHPPLIELTGGSLAHGLGRGGRPRDRLPDEGLARADLQLHDRRRGAGGLHVGVRDVRRPPSASSNLVNVIDVNATQADGDIVLEIEPLAEKWRAFGWWAHECDGNDVAALLGAFDRGARAPSGQPKAVVCRTTLGRGVPLIERARAQPLRARGRRRVGRRGARPGGVTDERRPRRAPGGPGRCWRSPVRSGARSWRSASDGPTW